MRPHLLAPALLALACSPGPAAPPVAPAPAPSPTPAASAAPALPTATAAPEAPEPPRARIGDPVTARFALAVDCKAPHLLVWPVGRGLLGSCGGTVASSAVFYLPEGGPPRLAPEVFKDLNLGRTEEGNGLGITSVEGPDLDHLEARVVQIMTRTGMSYLFRKGGGTWKQARSTAFGGDDGAPRDFGGVRIGERWLVQGFEGWRYDDGKPGWLPRAVKATDCGDPLYPFTALTVIGPDLWGVAACDDKLFAQRWTVGKDDSAVTSLGLPGVEGQLYGTLSRLGSGWLLRLLGSRSAALFDGVKWQALPPLPDTSYARAPVSVGGRAWLFGDGPLLRFTGRDFESIAVPGGKTASVAATPEGEIRVVTPAGVFAFGADEAWHAVPIPPLPSGAQIESLDRRAMGWLAWLRFEEYGHEQLLVDGLRGPPLVIEDPGAIVSPVAYVTPLDASCVEPFAMLYKVSRTAPRDYGYPATRAALAGQADLAGARFSEVEAFRDRYLIARFKGKRQRELLARLVARVRDKVQGSKPQLLCADKVPSPGLPTTREVDLR